MEAEAKYLYLKDLFLRLQSQKSLNSSFIQELLTNQMYVFPFSSISQTLNLDNLKPLLYRIINELKQEIEFTLLPVLMKKTDGDDDFENEVMIEIYRGKDITDDYEEALFEMKVNRGPIVCHTHPVNTKYNVSPPSSRDYADCCFEKYFTKKQRYSFVFSADGVYFYYPRTSLIALVEDDIIKNGKFYFSCYQFPEQAEFVKNLVFEATNTAHILFNTNDDYNQYINTIQSMFNIEFRPWSESWDNFEVPLTELEYEEFKTFHSARNSKELQKYYIKCDDDDNMDLYHDPQYFIFDKDQSDLIFDQIQSTGKGDIVKMRVT